MQRTGLRITVLICTGLAATLLVGRISIPPYHVESLNSANRLNANISVRFTGQFKTYCSHYGCVDVSGHKSFPWNSEIDIEYILERKQDMTRPVMIVETEQNNIQKLGKVPEQIIRDGLQNNVIILLDAASYSSLIHYAPNFYAFLDSLYSDSMSSHTLYRFFPGLSGANSFPNKAAMFGSGGLWLQEHYIRQNFTVAHLSTDGTYTMEQQTVLDKMLFDATGITANWTFSHERFRNQSGNCSSPIKDDGCVYVDQNTGEKLGSAVPFDGAFGCRAQCYNGILKDRLILEDAVKLLTNADSRVLAYVELLDFHNINRAWNAGLEPLLINFLVKVMQIPGTFVQVLSDHGLHYGKTWASEIGKVEHLIPFWFILSPSTLFSEDQRKILRVNEQSRLTWNDFHATNLDLVGPVKNQGGFRIHKDNVPPRTCKQANIPHAYCLRLFPRERCLDQSRKIDLTAFNAQNDDPEMCTTLHENMVQNLTHICSGDLLIKSSVNLVFNNHTFVFDWYYDENGAVDSIKPVSNIGHLLDPCREKAKTIETCLCRL